MRDWVLRFNAEGLDDLKDGKALGQTRKLNEAQRRALVAMVEAGPISAIHGVVRWRLIDLAQWVYDEYAISVTKQVLSRELRGMHYRKLSARPRHHAQDAVAIASLKKDFGALVEGVAAEAGGKPIEVWFADEARIG